ncbi:MAG: FecR domain-containing protein [Saprospiraceae bacterium]|nr:FecR domain-containing protein [Saprospiraceae bacterium]
MNIDQIIGKLMGDGSIGEEKSTLEAWKKEAEDNMKALEEIKKIASLSNTLEGYEDFNSDEAWAEFESQLNSQEEKPISKKENKTSVFSIGYLARIAAVLIVVAGSIFIFNTYSQPVTGDEFVSNYTTTSDILEVNLEDGTNVTLDKMSDLKIVKEREVSLIGRAYFNVSKDPNAKFKIDLPVGNITVLGTEFTVDADEITTEIYVTEGSVRYQLERRTWTLVAGDLVKVVDNEAIVVKGRDENIDSWKNQRLIFRDANMVEVVDALARHFKRDVIIEDETQFKNCNVFDVFTNKSLNQILNGLSDTHGLSYVIRDKKVFIVSAKC